MKIAFDIDDTLASLVPLIIHYFNRRLNTSIKISEITHYELEKVFGVEKAQTDKVFETIFGERGHDLPLIKGAQEAVEVCQQRGDELYIITSRFPFCHDMTYSWLEQYLPQFEREKVFFTHSKEGTKHSKGKICDNVGIDALIDDAAYNIASAANGQRELFLLSYPWNTSSEGLKVLDAHKGKYKIVGRHDINHIHHMHSGFEEFIAWRESLDY